MARVTFANQGLQVQVEEGTTIIRAAKLLGITIEAPCNGEGTCGKCKVRIAKEDLGAVEFRDPKGRITAEERQQGYVLACQSVIRGDATVYYESTEKQNESLKILQEGTRFQVEIDPAIRKEVRTAQEVSTCVLADGKPAGEEKGDTVQALYGVSIDIGTTTVVSSLIDLNTGQELGSVSALNPQSLQAQDVLTRIKFASTPEGLQEMYDCITAEFNRMIGSLCSKAGIARENIYEVVYSGNTTMIHLAGGYDPKSLGKYPYTPVTRGAHCVPAAEGKLNISPFGRIYYPPIISSFVGPDITSGVLATQLEKAKKTTLFIDIGTNGEMVIAKDGVLSATSAAAGPAFEGMNITFGMRAGDGAIESFSIEEDGQIRISVIGGTKPEGICGSGLFDVTGELIRWGIITKNGRFVKKEKLPEDHPLADRLSTYNGKPAFLIAEEVYLTISDIRQIQLAKGAVLSGVIALMQSLHVSEDEVEDVLVAGSFGYHLREESLMNVAIFPEGFRGKIRFVGNTSRTGAEAFLLNQGTRTYMERVASSVRSVELADQPGFNDLFVKSLQF